MRAIHSSVLGIRVEKDERDAERHSRPAFAVPRPVVDQQDRAAANRPGSPAAAEQNGQRNRAGEAAGSSAGQAAEQARRQSGGRVLSTERQGADGYRVKVLTPEGRVRKIDVPEQR